MVAPRPGATAPPRATSSTTVSPRDVPQLSSPTFRPGEALPAENLCGGPTPPSLSWSNLPKNTKEVVLALYALTPDAPVYWFVTGIDPATTRFTGVLPAGATEQVNTFGGSGWFAPCPPDGETQSFQFEILALPAAATITGGLTPTALLQQLEAQSGGRRGFLPTTILGGAAGSSTPSTELTPGSADVTPGPSGSTGPGGSLVADSTRSDPSTSEP